MTILEILDIKKFTSDLFLGTLFDSFFLIDADFVTFSSFHLDGRLQLSYFDTEEQNTLQKAGQNYSFWKDHKDFCRSLIRGKKLPLRFKITLQLPALLLAEKQVVATLDRNETYYLNIQYRDQKLLCTTGISYASFLPDKRLEILFDDFIRQFFFEHSIACQSL